MNPKGTYNPYRYTGRHFLCRGDSLGLIVIIALICIWLNIWRILEYRSNYELVTTGTWEVYETDIDWIYDVKVQYIYEGGMYWEVMRGINAPLLNMSIDRLKSNAFETYLQVYVNTKNPFDCVMMTYSPIYSILGQSILLLFILVGIPIYVSKKGWSV